MSQDKRIVYENIDLLRYAERNREDIDNFLDNEFQFRKPESPAPKPQTTLFPEVELNQITKVKRKTKKPV